MSQITFTGPASGTGTVNVSAPVTNTERNLTLPDMSGTITAASSGTPDATTFLRGDGAWAAAGSPPGTVDLLQEDTITASGTWTKATGFDADDTVMVFLIGGGGSGGSVYVNTDSGSSLGGYAGSVVVLTGRYANVPTSTYTLTLGAGASGVTRTTAGRNSGTSGSQSILQSADSYFAAGGGSGGRGDNGSLSPGAVQNPYNDNYSQMTNPFQGFSAGRVEGTRIDILDDSVFTKTGTMLFTSTGNAGADPSTNTLADAQRGPAGQLISSGGGAARAGATDRPVYNAVTAALLYNNGGAGSGTANGQAATGFGGGGGGCVRQNANSVSGAGGNGAMVVRYYRGRVSPFQVVFGSST